MKNKVLAIINRHIGVATSMSINNKNDEFYNGMLSILYLIEQEIKELHED